MLLQAEAVSVDLGEARVLSGVDVTLQPGELLGLIGPNGAGKTTLLRLLAGLQTPGEGRVLYDGLPLTASGRRSLARRLAYLAQSTSVHWPMTVERLVALGRLPHRGPWRGESAADRAAVEAAMERCGVEAFRNRTLATLSGGERRRVLLARALATEPEVLLADEPVAALDPYHQLHVMELLRGEALAGRSVVVVLHDLPLALRFCHRLALLHHGRLVETGEPAAVLGEGNLRDVYGVTALRGESPHSFVLPWQRTDETLPEMK